MKKWTPLVLAFVALLCSSACGEPYAVKRRAETAIEQSLLRFHTQLNGEQYAEIYNQAHESLRREVGEADFTARLVEARKQSGMFKTDNPIVIVNDNLLRDLSRPFRQSERVSHIETTGCEAGVAFEKFDWIVKNDEAKLAGYQFKEAGKNFVFGISGPRR